MSPEEDIEFRKLRAKNLELRGEVANLLAAVETPNILEEVLRKMIADRDKEIAGMFGSSLCVRCERVLAAESGFVRSTPVTVLNE